MPDVLVRNVPQEVLDALKQRAERNHRSLQQELLTILEHATPLIRPADPNAWKGIEELQDYWRQQGKVFSDSTELIREDRQR